MKSGVKFIELTHKIGILDISKILIVNHLIAIWVEAEVSIVVVQTSCAGGVFFEVVADVI